MSRSGTGRWRFGASAAGSSGSTGGGALGEVGGVLAEGVGIQGEHRWRFGVWAAGSLSSGVPLGSIQGQGGGVQLGGVLAEGGGGIQNKHGPVALRVIGGWQLERRRSLGSVQGQISGRPLGGVVQREHGLVAHGVTRGAGRLDASPVSEAGGGSGGVQLEHRSGALRIIGDWQDGRAASRARSAASRLAGPCSAASSKSSPGRWCMG